jgi:hypothetical protein
LEALGTSTRFDGAPLVDTLFNDGTAHFPVAGYLAPSAFSIGVASLALNYPTALKGGEMTVVARSSPFSYLDKNDDGTWDLDEPRGAFIVAGHQKIGEGHLVLLADPSVFISTMLMAEDNGRFIANVINIAGPNPRVLVDQAHLSPSRKDTAKSAVATVRQVVAQPLPLAVLLVVTGVTLLAPAWWRKDA